MPTDTAQQRTVISIVRIQLHCLLYVFKRLLAVPHSRILIVVEMIGEHEISRCGTGIELECT
jgi:hypothetical protein